MASSGKPVHIDEVVKIEAEINDHKENLALDSTITGAFVFNGTNFNEEQKNELVCDIADVAQEEGAFKRSLVINAVEDYDDKKQIQSDAIETSGREVTSLDVEKILIVDRIQDAIVDVLQGSGREILQRR